MPIFDPQNWKFHVIKTIQNILLKYPQTTVTTALRAYF